MASVLLTAYELGDQIISSAEVADYLYWKTRKEEDLEALELIRKFGKSKERFEECERFGHFHPNYHEALNEVEKVRGLMDQCESLRRFREAEDKLDDLLHAVSTTIAHSVSETIKVPGNNPLPEGGGCSTGSCSTGGCGGKCG